MKKKLTDGPESLQNFHVLGYSGAGLIAVKK